MEESQESSAVARRLPGPTARSRVLSSEFPWVLEAQMQLNKPQVVKHLVSGDRADVNRAQDLDGATSMQRVWVSQDTPGRRGRADANRAQDLEHCDHAALVCVTRHT